METKKVLFIFISTLLIVEGHVSLYLEPKNGAFDTELYENVLNSEQCLKQLNLLLNNQTVLLARFLDAGLRVPKGVLLGNNIHLGNYHQCLGIHETVQDMTIEGKYCMINVPVVQNFNLLDFENWSKSEFKNLVMDEEVVKYLEELNALKKGYMNIIGGGFGDTLRDLPIHQQVGLTYRLAICLPKPCSIQDIANEINININYNEDFCRLKNDKPWVPADTVAVSVFSVIALLTLMSTIFDVWHIFILRKDPRTVNIICRSFSIYNNTRRLVNFPPNPNAIGCLDGVRVLAMLWVIIGHSFLAQPFFYNNIDVLEWITSPRSLWIQAAPVTVDTFFMISGLLVVYTTAGKLTSMKLLKSLHLFYLNRLLRMLPILATVVLLEASLFHRLLDGPMWRIIADNAERCRTFWWTTLLYVQNYISPERICIGPTWYLAVDVQLHFLSPLVLFWVLSGNNRLAWGALATALLGILPAAALYCFQKEFPAAFTGLNQSIEEKMSYFFNYYINTLTRASPFVVGMLYGYLLHICRKRQIKMPAMLNMLLWVFSLAILGLIVYAVVPVTRDDWDNRLVDGLYNSFLRPAWAAALGWIVFACAKGYGGPVNWFLSLQVWKLPSRLSYAMYLFHFSLILIMNCSRTEPIWFSVHYIIFLFFAYLSITFVVAFVATVVIDAPMMILLKTALSRGSN